MQNYILISSVLLADEAFPLKPRKQNGPVWQPCSEGISGAAMKHSMQCVVTRGSPCHCHVKHCDLPPRMQGNNAVWATPWNYSYSGYCSPLSRGLPVQQGHMGSHQETADTDSEQAWPLHCLSFAKITISAGKSQGEDFFLYLIKAIQLPPFRALYISIT